MIKCPKCETDILDLNLVKCLICGADLKVDNDEEDDDDFLLSDSAFNHISPTDDTDDALGFDDDLGIESTSSFMEKTNEAAPTPKLDEIAETDFSSLAEPLPSESQSINKTDKKNVSKSTLNTLSDDEIKNIENNLYVSSNLLTDSEKSDLMNKLDSIEERPAFSNTPIVPRKKNQKENQNIPVAPAAFPEQANSSQPLSTKTRSLAYYYKNYIELSGNRKITDGDQLIYKDCLYILKPKSIKSTFKFGFFGIALAVVLMFAGSFFIRDFGGSDGQIIGVVLDEYDQPTSDNASIVIPDLKRKVQANSQGFFHFDNIPDGPHKVQYWVGDKIVNEEFITISDGKVSSTYLRPDNKIDNLAQVEQPSAVEPPVAKEPLKKAITPPSVEKKTTAINKQRLRSKSKTVKSTTPTYGKLTLSTNIENAKLILDGSVLGAGNTTYSNIKAGTHTYRIVSEGYESNVGKIKISSGKTNTLIVDLNPIVTAKKKSSKTVIDYYQTAQKAYNEKDFKTVVENINVVIAAQPSNADALFIRAKANNNLLFDDDAYADYITAGDLYKETIFSKSLTCYNEAMKIDPKGVESYIGRGYLYFYKKEYLAAIADFDRVTHIDKRNFLGYYGLGESRFKMEQYRKAIKHFADARSVNPSSPVVHQYLMLSYMQVNDNKNVVKAYDKYLQVATQKDVNNLANNKDYAAVMKVVTSNRKN